ncbi:MAG: hemolysin family protein [Candidatus Heteroscillospira sp.]|jgi:putative hemolysin
MRKTKECSSIMEEGSLLSWFIIFMLLLAAAYFAVAETALASVSRIRLKTLMDRGDNRARRAMAVLDDFDKAITTILIGTNITHLAVASMVTVIVRRELGMSFVAISTIATTIVVFFAAEMLPKSIGKKYSERFALATAGSLSFLMKLLTPVSAVLSFIGSAVAKLTPGDAEKTVTEDELYDIIENMKDDGELDAEKGELVHSALMFADVTVEGVLTSRVDVAAINVADSQEEILAKIKEEKHSRLPVYRDSIDNIIGILQIRKYIKAYLREGPGLDIVSLLDEAYFVHQSTNIDELLPAMSRHKMNMAIVTDNYGGTLGIVTIEDILEELVGDIWDEDDDVVESFRPLPDGGVEVDAEASIEDTFEYLDFTDPEDNEWNHKLMGEWAYEQFELLPREGDSFIYHEVKFVISKMQNHRIMKISVYLPKSAEAAEGGEE